MADEKIVNIVMKMVLDPTDFANFKAGLMNVDEQLAKFAPAIDEANTAYNNQIKKIDEVRKHMNGLREQAEKLQSVGMAIGMPSAAALGALGMAAKKYVDSQKETETVSRRILELQKQGEDITIRIGRVVATEALPFLEKAAQLAEKVAAFAESHPEIIAAALKISAAGVVAGSAIGMAAQGAKVAGTIGGLLAPQLAGGSAEAAARAAMGAGTFADRLAMAGAGASGTGVRPDIGALGGASGAQIATVTVGSLVVGSIIGKGIGDFVNKMLGQSTDDTTGATIFKFTNLGLRKLSDSLQQTDGVIGQSALGVLKWQDGIVDYLNGVDREAEATDKAAQEERLLTDARKKSAEIAKAVTASRVAMSRAEMDYSDKQATVIADYDKKRADIIAAGAGKIADIEAKGIQARVDIIKNLLEESVKAEYAYNTERSRVVRDGGIEIRRIEEDSQRRIAKMRQEFEDRTKNAVADRDALGVLEAKRDFDRQVAEERDNTNLEIKRRREDIALQLEDMATSYNYEQEMRTQAAQDKLNEQARTEQIELDTARAYQTAQLAEAVAAHNAQLAELKTFYEAQMFMLRQALSDATTPPGAKNPGRALGGYVNRGTYDLHNNEFVMTAATTRAAETIAGGALTQQGLLSAMTNNFYVPEGGSISQMGRMLANHTREIGDMITGAFEQMAAT